MFVIFCSISFSLFVFFQKRFFSYLRIYFWSMPLQSHFPSLNTIWIKRIKILWCYRIIVTIIWELEEGFYMSPLVYHKITVIFKFFKAVCIYLSITILFPFKVTPLKYQTLLPAFFPIFETLLKCIFWFRQQLLFWFYFYLLNRSKTLSFHQQAPSPINTVVKVWLRFCFWPKTHAQASPQS